ncbi:MAG TPA: beta-eliminating lyase-related protein [Solirubrobacteraceae bacterium]|nr:beta-eliminating lyase-related protein [Solirubrobacteraceae bacterium]
MTAETPEWQLVMRGCDRWLGSRRPLRAADRLRAAADALHPDDWPDHYGDGDVVDGFERRLAELLGTEAAAVFPSGTMAQQVALRIHCDARGADTVAFHPTCHLELHEHAGYQHLHGLRAELVGAPDRLITREDFDGLHARLGALLLELPQREIGGRLPEWDELLAQLDWARERGVATHLDGARIWEAAPYYERAPADLAALFDTIYVSLYKGLGGIGGSVLAGPARVIDEARVWRRRHGGTQPQLFGFVAGALSGLNRLAPRMPEFLAHARALGAALREVPGLQLVPDPPQTPLFHVLLRGDRERLEQRARELARERGVWLFGPLRPTEVDDVARIELNIGEPALDISPDEAAELFSLVLGPG